MTTTTDHASVLVSPTPARYEALLAERVRLGRQTIDAICHPEARPVLARLFNQTQAADKPLLRFRRYLGGDYLRTVTPAEDARFHQPGNPPADGSGQPCTWCEHTLIGLPVDVVLAPQVGASA